MSFITAVIPVRGGSRRLPNKNILPFGESNLLVHKIRQLKKINSIDSIIVSSDSDTMLEMALKEGCGIQKRPDEYCDEKTKSFNEVVEYVSENIDCTHIIWAPCVCPLVNEQMYTNAINLYLNLEEGYDSLISGKYFKEYIYGDKGPVNYNAEKHVPSQYLPDWKVIINGFYIAKRLDMIKWKYLYGKNPYIYC